VSTPTCRFFSIAFAPKSSHFYTPFPAECQYVETNPADVAAWEFESIAFYMELADANGNCPGGTIPLYRLYNNGMGGAPNHRYTVDTLIFNQMICSGLGLRRQWKHKGVCVRTGITISRRVTRRVRAGRTRGSRRSEWSQGRDSCRPLLFFLGLEILVPANHDVFVRRMPESDTQADFLHEVEMRKADKSLVNLATNRAS
jgi:hypothetical protein